MSPWKHFSVHALEQAYIRLGVDCYELMMYVANQEVKEITKEATVGVFHVVHFGKGHKYYTFKHPKKNEDVLAIVHDGVVLTILTKDLESLNLKPQHRRGKNSQITTLGGDVIEYRGI